MHSRSVQRTVHLRAATVPRMAQTDALLVALAEDDPGFGGGIVSACRRSGRPGVGCRHPAVFCYDLMNEPVITPAKPGEHPWLTGEMGGFHFVQRISNQPGARSQAEIAAAWAGQMTQAMAGRTPESPAFRISGEGEVSQMGATWIIAGQSFQTDNNTVVTGSPQMGDLVHVEGHLTPDGVRLGVFAPCGRGPWPGRTIP